MYSLAEAARMIITDATQRLDSALQRGHTDDVLCAFLQLSLVVEAMIQSHAQVIETMLTPTDQQLYATTIAILRERDMLTFITAAPTETIMSLRLLIQTDQSTQVTDWYRQHWNQPNWSTEIILASIANTLRPVMTIILGNTALLRRLLDMSVEQLAALQSIIDAIEILRTSRTQIQLYLAGKGVTIQPF